AFDAAREKLADERVRRPMALAARRLEQVLAGLEEAPKKADAKQPDPKQPDSKQAAPKSPPQLPQAQPGNENQIVPPIAQLKALLELQVEFNVHTAAFDKTHPKRTKLTDDVKYHQMVIVHIRCESTDLSLIESE